MTTSLTLWSLTKSKAMNRFEQRTTNNFYSDLQIDGEPYPITGDRYRKPDFTQPRNEAANESIRFATRKSFLGLILVAASEKGICAILLGDNAKHLVAELRSCFSKASLIAGDADFEETLVKVVRAVETPGSKLDLPIDLRGTELQRRVWQALREIPAGATATYKEIAAKIGMSTTAQEVGEACAANALAVVVPCHRVVRTDRSLAGYRWGINRKRALLQKEQEASPEPGTLFHATARYRVVSSAD
ncbi:MAG TPA: methylated-DNA--[protein]-cysteine S-methyltransferase [Pyrinomonadaceae bacterium]|jgi:AraC family transcriptional regulator of adaptative response/methylated-DNA-[protein]-cysteine methyltransferase|nr:methylated-DNA--[protein]-cysteine S-methyltransferase [Pyrinomonadaceae bacterium]